MIIKKEIELDSKLTELEIACDKAAVICNDLNDLYFGSSNPDEYMLDRYYEDAMLRNRIVFDYLYEMKETVKQIKKISNDDDELQSVQDGKQVG